MVVLVLWALTFSDMGELVDKVVEKIGEYLNAECVANTGNGSSIDCQLRREMIFLWHLYCVISFSTQQPGYKSRSTMAQDCGSNRRKQ